MKKDSIILVIILFALLNPNNFVLAQMTKEQVEAFRSAKSVKVVVEQSYGSAEGISLPFKEVATKLIKHAGLQVMDSNSEDFDLKLTIVARGQGLSRYYSNVQETLYTGASLSGSIAIETQGRLRYEQAFQRVLEPPVHYYSYLPIDFLKSPSISRFEDLLSVPSPIILTIMNIVGEIYGSNVLIESLGEEERFIRNNARVALENIGAPSVELLIPVLKEQNFEVRQQAAMALGNINDPRAVEPLISILKDEHHFVRWMAVNSLGKIMDTRAVEPLIDSLDDEDSDIQRKAEEVLEKITGQDLGPDQEKWKKWWDKNKDEFSKVR
jgi:hypothetical protein